MYVDETQPYRKEAARQGERVPAQDQPPQNAELGVRTRQNVLADALRQKIRPAARQGDLIPQAVATVIKRQVADLFNGLKRPLLLDELAEQNEGQHAAVSTIALNQHVAAPLVPPLLLDALPALPAQLEYDFLGRTLILRDVDADVVVDYLPDALPAQVSAPSSPPVQVAPIAGATFLAIPHVLGGTVFALLGDSGSGDQAQAVVADAMLNYFTNAERFPYVLMLGDNLYDDDYMNEFLTPYKPLLDRGVMFYAALGNHDRDLEQHFKPFHMQDREYYTFDRGNARFAVLNTNHPNDPAQLRWLDSVFDDAGSKWRICFFHHPLYSSGPHAEQSREVFRPALEPALVRNHVNVVFSGHDHLYERVAPQHGIRYFVSGGGGRTLYDVDRRPFDEIAVSVHHFMIISIAADEMFYEALRPNGQTIDCGIDWRTPRAEEKMSKVDAAWLSACATATALRAAPE
jgi:hypothetical protein